MLKRILVGLGGTEYTVSAINEAVALAMANNAELNGVSIIDQERLRPVGSVSISGINLPPERDVGLMEQARERSEVAMEKFTEACRAAGVRHHFQF